MQPMKIFLLLLGVYTVVSVINLRVSIYSVVVQYFIYYVIIMITYLLKCVSCSYYVLIFIIGGLAVLSDLKMATNRGRNM
jgi:hypothetical protein